MTLSVEFLFGDAPLDYNHSLRLTKRLHVEYNIVVLLSQQNVVHLATKL